METIKTILAAIFGGIFILAFNILWLVAIVVGVLWVIGLIF